MSEDGLCTLLNEFTCVDAALNDLVSADGEPGEHIFLALHRRWEDVCSRAAATGADTLPGLCAKAQILLGALRVLEPAEEGQTLLQRLAETLARDLLALVTAKQLH